MTALPTLSRRNKDRRINVMLSAPCFWMSTLLHALDKAFSRDGREKSFSYLSSYTDAFWNSESASSSCSNLYIRDFICLVNEGSSEYFCSNSPTRLKCDELS